MAAGAVAAPQIMPLYYTTGAPARRNEIDTGTKIEISTDTPRTYIYFTVDGTRPGEGRGTRKYRQPFSLPPGKYTIKAIAVAPDGRESAVASRTFSVVGIKGAIDAHNPETSRSDGSHFMHEMSSRSERHSSRPFSKDAFARNLHSAWAEEQGTQTLTTKRPSVETYTSSAVHDDRSRSLVKEIAQQRLQPGYENLYTCARCGLRLTPGASRCVVCECDSILVTALPSAHNSPVPVSATTQVVPMNAPPGWPTVSCLVCGVSNPSGIARCLSCATVLANDTRPGFAGTSATPMPLMQSSTVPLPNTVTHVRCSSCARLNDIRARYCDWCAARLPSGQGLREGTQLCSKCGSPLLSPNRPCFTCGTLTIPPVRDNEGGSLSGTKQTGYQTHGIERDTWSRNNMTQSVSANLADPLQFSSKDNFVYKLNKASQTVQTGSFTAMPGDSVMFGTPRSRSGLPTSSLSPGRGYWRQQLKHINAQLESFASSSADFRAAVGPHQLGRLLAARVTNSGGDEFVLRLVFSLPQMHNQRTNLNGRDSARNGHHLNYDRRSQMSGASGIDAYSKYEPRRPTSGYSITSHLKSSKTQPGRYSAGSQHNKYADVDDYLTGSHKVNRLPIESHSSITGEDDELITGSEDSTTDHDILDTFREDDESGDTLQAYRRPGRRTNHRFVVSSTPRRAGRKMASAVVSRSLTGKRRAASAFEQQTQNKPAMLALKELGVDGAGRISELSRLFSESDVDLALKSRDGWSLAHLAVINRHPDCIPVIAQYAKGGDSSVGEALSSRGPSAAFGNTPLHEAVRLSTSSSAALHAMDALLSCGADVQRKNDRGETPFEYAQKLGHADAARKIAASMGQRRLKAAGLAGHQTKSDNKNNGGLSDD